MCPPALGILALGAVSHASFFYSCHNFFLQNVQFKGRNFSHCRIAGVCPAVQPSSNCGSGRIPKIFRPTSRAAATCSMTSRGETFLPRHCSRICRCADTAKLQNSAALLSSYSRTPRSHGRRLQGGWRINKREEEKKIYSDQTCKRCLTMFEMETDNVAIN